MRTSTTSGLRSYINRDQMTFDIRELRPVASLIIRPGPSVVIYTNEPADLFWVDDPGLPVITVHNTIRQAFSHAAKNGGWG